MQNCTPLKPLIIETALIGDSLIEDKKSDFIHVFPGLFKEMGTQEIPNSSSAPNNSEIQVQIQENMRSEAQRLSTFTSWPHNDKVEARKIAKAGFFHTGIGMY